MSNIEYRIKALEKANRRLHSVAGLLGGILIITLVCAMKSPAIVHDTLQAKRLEIVTPDGKPAMVLSADVDGSTLNLTGYGDEHTRAIELRADKEGARLMLMKHMEAPLLTAQVDDSGAVLSLFDGHEPSESPKYIVLRSNYSTKQRHGGAGVFINQRNQKDSLKAGLIVDDSGKSNLLLGDSEGKAVRVGVNQQNGKVEFVDRNGNGLWSTP